MISVRNLLFLGAGVGIGYLLARKSLEDAFQERLDEEIATAKKFYEKKYNDLKVERAAEAVQAYSGGTISKDVASAFIEKETLTIVQEDPEDEDDADTEYRDPTQVFVISQDEFMESKLDYDQQTLTYYQGDRVVANERDEALTLSETERVVGIKNLKKFGEQSGNDDIVYVRSHLLKTDTELVRSFGSYAEEVAGIGGSGGDAA